MAGTRTAPDIVVDGANAILFTIHLIDTSGDYYTESIRVAAEETDANLEAIADAYQAATQASIWKLSKTAIYEGDDDPDNAEALFRGSIADGINMLWRDPSTGNTVSPRLIAPVAAVMQGNQDIPLLTGTPLEALAVALGNVLGTAEFQQMQFTERKERKNNQTVKV